MKEDFLHYLWRFKKFDFSSLKTVQGENVTIINSGQYLQNSGPDFFNSQILIGNQKWAGNIEIHLKSSDWYLHNHEQDQSYDNVILHVVWNHDMPVYYKNNTEIPVLELQNYVDIDLINNYEKLQSAKSWIYCQNQISEIDPFALQNWQERLYVERLEIRSERILQTLQSLDNDWEATLFVLLAKNFGLNYNGQIFYDNLSQVPFQIIRKELFDLESIESILFGSSGLLEKDYDDLYFKSLQKRFTYIQQKYNLQLGFKAKPQFYKLRPDNFPTIRLAQLANLYHLHQQLFSKTIAIKNISEYFELFENGVSSYWENHYNFDVPSSNKKRKLSKAFKELLFINTIIPVIFTFYKFQNIENSDQIFQMINNLPPEKNNIVDKFSEIGIKSSNALQTQSLLQLKNNYCDKSRCLECNIGISLLKNHNTIN